MATNYDRLMKLLKNGNFPDSCMEWWAARTSSGYGVLSIPIRPGVDGRIGAHRASLEFKLGRILKSGMYALHTCDNPACFNPNHLYEGTTQQNVVDSFTRNRRPIRKGANHPMSKFSEADILRILQLCASGETHSQVAKSFGVSQQTISKIVNGTAWGHLFPEEREKAKAAKLTPSQASRKFWDNATPEQIENHRMRTARTSRKLWDGRGPEDIELVKQQMRAGQRQYESSLDEVGRAARSLRAQQIAARAGKEEMLRRAKKGGEARWKAKLPEDR